MRFNEKTDMRGEVLITSTDSSGKSTILVDDKNLIVLNGRRIVANHVLTGAGAHITNIVFGNGGTAPGNPNAVLPVTPSEKTVLASIPNLIMNSDYIFTVDSSTIDESVENTLIRPKLIYTINIPKINTNINGKQINELALMTDTETPSAFAIKRFATIVKSESISLNITWSLFF